MPAVERDSSHDRELVVKHQHSYSDGRLPMWDSSDPDRNPPPLPLNPGSPATVTRPNTSATVAAAAAALHEKATASLGNYITNPPPPKSPEKTLIRSAQHKRMQSLQTGTVRDLSKYIETRTPERSPERFLRSPDNLRNFENKSPECSPSRNGPRSPPERDFGDQDIPSGRPSSRHYSKPILGENTPPSATMRALQNMAVPSSLDGDPLKDMSLNAPSALIRNPQSFDAISTQILSLTNICTSLQREMMQLSRRSKDNATDLLSLREATNSRDEDIRRSLRELVSNMANRIESVKDQQAGFSLLENKGMTAGAPKGFTLPRIPSPSGFGPSIDRDMVTSPSPYPMEGAASIALLEKILREMGTKEGQERVIKALEDAIGKEASEDADKPTMKKLEEIHQFIKENAESRALIVHNGGGTGNIPPISDSEYSNGRSGSLARAFPDLHSNGGDMWNEPAPKASDFVTEDVWKLLKRMKDSVAESGGLTNEVKALVRELRGEVLGMGREIARKLEEAELSQQRSSGDETRGPDTEEIAEIIQTSLAELKEHMQHVMREKRRSSSSSMISRSEVDGQEIFNAVKNALAEVPLPRGLPQDSAISVEREDIIDAVREAWENYKPEIEVQHFGLERDELLQCLKEGLQEYQPQDQPREDSGATYEEVLEAVKAGLQDFPVPAPIETKASITREEILSAVRECLENFEFPTPPPAKELDLTKDDVQDAVKEALATEPSFSKEIEFNKEDLMDAVRAGLEGAPSPNDGVGERVLTTMESLIGDMKSEFKQYSAASGRDTEQVLDALKDGLEVLRTDIESYVDRTADVTGRDEIIDTLKGGLDTLREDLESSLAKRQDDVASADNNSEILDTLEREFDHLRQTLATSLVRSEGSTDKDDIIDALKTGLDSIKEEFSTALVTVPQPAGGNTAEILVALEKEFDVLRQTIGNDSGDKDEIIDTVKGCLGSLRDEIDASIINNTRNLGSGNTTEILDALEKEFDHLRQTIGSSLVRTDISNDKDEILDAIRDGFEEAKSKSPSDDNSNLAMTMKEEFEHLRETLATNILQGGSSSADKDEILDALREGIDSIRLDLGPNPHKEGSILSNTSELLDAFSDGLADLRADIDKIAKPSDMTVNYDILETLKEGLANLKSEIDSLKEEKGKNEELALSRTGDFASPGGTLTKDDIANLEVLITQLRIKVEALDTLASQQHPSAEPFEDSIRKDDLSNIEASLKEDLAAKGDLANVEASLKDDLAAKGDLASVEAALKETLGGIDLTVKEVQAAIGDLASREDVNTATKDDTDAIETLLRNTKAKVDEIVFPQPDTVARAEQLETLENTLKDTKTAIDEFSAQMAADGASKADFGVLEALIKDVQSNVEEVREQMKDDEEKAVTKVDIEAIGTLCTEMNVLIEGMRIPDPDTLPTKENIESLENLVKEFKENVEAENDLVAQAFDARKIEHGGLATKIEDVKSFVEAVRTELKEAIDDSGKEIGNGVGNGLEGLVKMLEGVEAVLATHTTVLATHATTDGLKELSELVTKEFERAHGQVDATKLDTEEKHTNLVAKHDEVQASIIARHDEVQASIIAKHDEVQATIIADLKAKIDERFEEIMTKYDDSQIASDAKIKALEDNGEKTLGAALSIEAVSKDLKECVDTLGATVTETAERLGDESKTVFTRVDETYNKVEEVRSDAKGDHQLTRDEVAKVLTALGGLEGQVAENHPKILDSIKNVLDLISSQFEQAQKATEEIKTTTEELKTSTEVIKCTVDGIPSAIPMPEIPPPAIMPPPEKYDDTVLHEKLNELRELISGQEKYDDSPVQEKLGELLNQEKYDDSPVQEKLTELLSREKYDDSVVQDKLAELHGLISGQEKYDDSTIQEKLGELHGLVSAQEKYDDSAIQEKLNELHGLITAQEKYDDSTIQEKLGELHGLISAQEKYDDSMVQQKLAELLSQKYDDSAVQEKLNELQALISSQEKYDDSAVQAKLAELLSLQEKYDDSPVQEKLNELLGHAAAAGQALTSMQMLDQIHQQVKNTATEIGQFVASQRTLIAEDQENMAKEAQEAAVALERRVAEKEHVEAEIADLKAEKDALLSAVEAMKREKEELASQKALLRADVSALETALRIRKEEVSLVENRAEELERRILEGVLDHSRSLLISRPHSTKAMNLKRVSSNAGTGTKAKGGKDHGSALSGGIGMALRRKPNSARMSLPAGLKERRILSLSEVGANKVPTPSIISSAGSKGLGNLKRSHSVKTNIPSRKPSWSERQPMSSIVDKENEISEEDESDTGSETATERRTSYDDTAADSYAAESSSADGSDLSDEEAEDMSVPNGAVVDEEEEDSEGESGSEYSDKADEAAPDKNDLVVFGQGADNALGSDLPTATVEGGAE
ncbi:MAG: hypothetical protein M1834_007137 [Cirrosporium novae-zelandiae]|nr:MAG: hypothetical protein M1834_007137 [Cirrosporium novae-zelandiae]